MYLVTYTGNGTTGQLEPGGATVSWENGDYRWVEDESIGFYQSHPSVFAVSPVNLPDLGDAEYVVDVMTSEAGEAAIKGIIDTPYIVSVVEAGFPGGRAAGYIDFNAVAEAGMTVTIGGVDYQEADTADAENGVFTNGASAADSATSLIAAINGDTRAAVPYTAAADLSGDGVWLYADAVGIAAMDSIHTSTPANVTGVPAAMIHFGGAGEAAMSVVIGGVIYLEADTAAATTGVWTNGTTAENSVDSLLAALNGDTRATVPFTAYKVGTADIFIKWDDAEETDAFVLSETSAANCTVYQARYLLFSGVGAPGTSIALGGFIFNEDDPAAPTTGVWTNGASAGDSATSLIAAINGDTRTSIPFTAVAGAGADLWLSQDVAGVQAASVNITAASSSCTVENMTGGADSEVKKIVNITHTVTANELLSGHIDFPIPFLPESWQVQAFTSAGAPVYFTDLVTWEASPTNIIRIATDGATNIAVTNTVHLVVIG